MSHANIPPFSVPAAPNADSIRLIVVGTPRAVENFVMAQHRLGYAEAVLWSPPLPTPHENQVMRILTKRLSFDQAEGFA
jgi:hypothetical protein